MRKFLYSLVLGFMVVVVIPSCSTADSLDEVIQESELDVNTSTDDEEDKVAKPGAS